MHWPDRVRWLGLGKIGNWKKATYWPQADELIFTIWSWISRGAIAKQISDWRFWKLMTKLQEFATLPHAFSSFPCKLYSPVNNYSCSYFVHWILYNLRVWYLSKQGYGHIAFWQVLHINWVWCRLPLGWSLSFLWEHTTHSGLKEPSTFPVKCLPDSLRGLWSSCDLLPGL